MGILFCRMILRLQVPRTKFHAKQNQDMLRASFVLFWYIYVLYLVFLHFWFYVYLQKGNIWFYPFQSVYTEFTVNKLLANNFKILV